MERAIGMARRVLMRGEWALFRRATSLMPDPRIRARVLRVPMPRESRKPLRSRAFCGTTSTTSSLDATTTSALCRALSLDAGRGRSSRAITTCGDLTYGFTGAGAPAPRAEHHAVAPVWSPGLAALSPPRWRLCPSCAGRRMNEQAAHLVDRVLPLAPYRQWVLTLPGELARVVAFDAELATAVFGVFAEELARWQRKRANDLGIAAPQTGSLLEIQRFADGARLYPHAHPGAAPPPRVEGVFVASSDGQSARFVRQDPPSDEDVAHVVSRVEQRLTRVLARWRARRQRDSAHDSEDTDILPACAEAPATEFVRILSQKEPEGRRPTRKKPLCARSPGGLELHAEVTVAAHDRKGLERLCRYLSRPPVPQDRLERRGDGKYVLSLKPPLRGSGRSARGIKGVVFETGPAALDPRRCATRSARACTLSGVAALPWRLHRTCGPGPASCSCTHRPHALPGLAALSPLRSPSHPGAPGA